jgi:pyruvoyl-dependent arginine decarboxylase (PvlArgDC)
MSGCILSFTQKDLTKSGLLFEEHQSVNTSKIDEKCEKHTIELQVLSTSKTVLRNKNLKNIKNQ